MAVAGSSCRKGSNVASQPMVAGDSTILLKGASQVPWWRASGRKRCRVGPYLVGGATASWVAGPPGGGSQNIQPPDVPSDARQVPPSSMTWSCRSEASISRRRTPATRWPATRLVAVGAKREVDGGGFGHAVKSTGSSRWELATAHGRETGRAQKDHLRSEFVRGSRVSPFAREIALRCANRTSTRVRRRTG